MRKILLLLVVLALAPGGGPVRVQPAAAAQPVRFVILPLSQSYLLVARGLYSPSTWSLKFLYPEGWMLSTNPPGLYGVAPDLTQSGLGIFVTPERRGITHFSFSQSPVLSRVVDMRSAIAQYLAQRAPGAVIVQSFAFPPVVIGTTRVDRVRMIYRGRPGGVPVEGLLTVTVGMYALYGAYSSNIVAEEFQIALDLPQSQLYTYLSGLQGIFRTLSSSVERDTGQHPAHGMMKQLGGSSSGKAPDGTDVPVPPGSRDCWIKRFGHREVVCNVPPPGPGPDWEPVEVS